jgi:hypothetical protein
VELKASRCIPTATLGQRAPSTAATRSGSRRRLLVTTAKRCIAPTHARPRSNCLLWKVTNDKPRMVVSSGYRRIRRRIGPAVSVSPSVEPIVSIRSTLATSVAGVSFAPVLANSITGASEPFLVTPKLFKSLGCEELRGVSGGMAERFQ